MVKKIFLFSVLDKIIKNGNFIECGIIIITPKKYENI